MRGRGGEMEDGRQTVAMVLEISAGQPKQPMLKVKREKIRERERERGRRNLTKNTI